ncbi:hypothetical protein JTE90_014981 [Oedothorax gibbosus]|uniref:Pyridoxal-dependent decarboxylase domain-containing protein 1 n=1 Tax=Oedothorax gibbosus TaxID=931172 RepID=A0AAV6UXR0_9ARAC|nr:hypothetical protein JTE90_014981 [Oedothorax gibbosus]
MSETSKNSNDKTAENEVGATLQDKSVDSSSLESLQNLAEAGLDRLEESVSGTDTASREKCIPGPLPRESKVFSEIKESLLGLIAKSEAEEEEEVIISYTRPARHIHSEVQKAALLSHTFAAYLHSLNRGLVCRVATQVVSDTSLWLGKIFRFFDSSAYFSRDPREGLVRTLRLVLHTRYPRYATTGYEALFTRPPSLYYCDPHAHDTHLPYICAQLGLPLTCLTAVPSHTIDGQFKMSPSALEQCIQADLSATRTPLVALCSWGARQVGHADDLHQIKEVCNRHRVWMHLEGHGLAALALPTPAAETPLGDSMTLSLGDWIGLPSLPYTTLYRAKEPGPLLASGLVQTSGQLDFLPVWFALQALGCDTLMQMVRHAFHVTEDLLNCIEHFPELRIISQRKSSPKESVSSETTADKNQPTPVSFESPVIVFQYVPRSEKGEEFLERNPPYFDNLNSWLVQLMARLVPTVKTEILDLPTFGVCLRICPLENANTLGTTKKDVEHYFLSLQQQIAILNATVHQKEKLYADHKNYPKLQLVEIANWAGMGGVRYIPELWVDRLNELTDTGKADINQLNSALVTKLKDSDSAFSLGEADDGMVCVRFGMVDAHLDLEELMQMVTAAGRDIEESSKFLETMSEMIKQGIQEANKELVKENQEKIYQEGVLKQVPVIGSLVSWFYPAQNETGIKGRSFNLSSGTIESTENIYKYHMQVKAETKSRNPSQASDVAAPDAQQVAPPDASP